MADKTATIGADDYAVCGKEYFSAQARREEFAFDDGSAVVFERFRIVWPVRFADPAQAD